MFNKKRSVIFLAVMIAIFISVGVVLAAGYDLTVVGSEVTINDAIYESIAPTDPTGSGGFDAFLRTQNDPSEIGFNSDLSNSNYEFDEVSGCCTHSITLDEIPEVVRASNATKYRIFELDINESGSEPENLLTMDVIQLFEATAGDTCGYPFDGSVVCPGSSNTAAMIYNMDAGEDNFVVLDYNNNAGSGKRDMRLWVPDAVFSQDPNCDYQSPTADQCSVYIVLYNEFGLDFDANAASPLDTNHPSDTGFEEWGVPTEDIPTAISFSDMAANVQSSGFITIVAALVLLLGTVTLVMTRKSRQSV